MTTSPPSADGPEDETPPRRARAAVLWTIFVLLLAAGVVFAFRFGGSVPVLIDSVN